MEELGQIKTTKNIINMSSVRCPLWLMDIIHNIPRTTVLHSFQANIAIKCNAIRHAIIIIVNSNRNSIVAIVIIQSINQMYVS